MGQAALVAGAIVASIGGFCALIRPAWERRLTAVAVALLVVAVIDLIRLLIGEDTSYAIVVDHTRPGLDAFRRAMGLWGGSEGSLLAFTIVTGSVLVVAPLQSTLRVARPVVVAVLAWTSVAVASPFVRLENPAVAGSGLSPILEHWAMLIHPPLLYLGLALALIPAAVDPDQRRRWVRAAIAVLTSALALGGGWAYVELGWGGWWAWDPVENVALIPWLLLVATLHLPAQHALTRWSLLCIWPAVFAGTAMTRTSLRTSVHAFANSETLGWVLWPLLGVIVVFTLLHGTRNRSASPSLLAVEQLVPSLVLLTTAVIVAAGTFRPFVPGDATEGTFYARFLFPIVVTGLIGLGVVPRLGTRPLRLVGEAFGGALFSVAACALAGWSNWWQLVLGASLGAALTTAVGGGVRPIARVAAHVAIVCIIAGALGGTASTTQTFSLEAGAATELEGVAISNAGVELESGEQPVLTALIEVDGRTVRPSLTIYPERRLRLPEVATIRGPLRDVQVILRGADDDGTVTITVNTEPLTQLVWIGAGLLVFAMVTSARNTRRRDSTESVTRSASVDVNEGAR